VLCATDTVPSFRTNLLATYIGYINHLAANCAVCSSPDTTQQHIPGGSFLHAHFLRAIQSHTRRQICWFSYQNFSPWTLLVLLWRTRKVFTGDADFVWGRGRAFHCPPNFYESCCDLIVFYCGLRSNMSIKLVCF